ncbi:hypothetical protein K1719_026883 [Acacia pycnantha]|nr:hypothetical protein K1719_026883 [Acacia pycnantha]
MPRIASHLESMGFDVSLVATEWFLCLFSKSLPSELQQAVSLLQQEKFKSSSRSIVDVDVVDVDYILFELQHINKTKIIVIQNSIIFASLKDERTFTSLDLNLICDYG